MRVMSGYSFERSDRVWRKIEVECDEVDLERLSQEHGVYPVTTLDAYLLLELEAEWFAVWKTHQGGGMSQTEYEARSAEYRDQRAKALERIRASAPRRSGQQAGQQAGQQSG